MRQTPDPNLIGRKQRPAEAAQAGRGTHVLVTAGLPTQPSVGSTSLRATGPAEGAVSTTAAADEEESAPESADPVLV